MPIYNWPLHKWIPASGTFRVKSIPSLSVSPYTGASRSASGGMMWVAEQTWPAQTLYEAHEIQAFLDRLEGPVNPVLIPVWNRMGLRALIGSEMSNSETQALAITGEPWSDGLFFDDGYGWSDPSWSITVSLAALVNVRSVTLSGFPDSTLVLHPGDVLKFGDNTVEVMDHVTSDTNGTALVPILPGLRRGVAAGTAVSYTLQTVLMRVDPSSVAEVRREIVNSVPFSLRFIEAIDLP